MRSPDTDVLLRYWDPPKRANAVSTQTLVAPWEAYARQNPERICIQPIEEGAEAWTWGRVAEAAHLMAINMKLAGLLPGCRIALMGEASVQWVVAMWACWICEGVWCPLPPSMPALRREALLAELNPHLTWEDGRVRARCSGGEKCPEGSAYITYTSGSTGKPKGVLVASDGLAVLWQAQQALFRTTADSRVAWMLSPAFDASVSDVGVALCAGATLVPVPPGRWRRFQRWHDDMTRLQIDQVDAPPGWLALWAARNPPTPLRTIVAGGEPTPASILEAWSNRLHWVNVYGPTEATVCTSAQVRRILPGDPVHNTLGNPLPGVHYRLVPVDADDPLARLDRGDCDEGELWIGGNAVALGYWQDPARTAERFFEHKGLRWFRTGDAVRRRDGEWIYLGRIDRQVKLRGQLLHLDETESVLAAMPGVASCVAVVDECDRLVVAVHEHTPDDEALRTWARARLPSWGIPQRFIRVRQWPTTTTGKIDRQAVAERLRGEC